MSSPPHELFNYTTRRKNIVDKASVKLQSQYPSEWFEKNAGSKPTIIIPVSGLSKEDLPQVVYKDLVTGKINMNHINEFIYSQLDTIEGILSEDWVSFDVKIGNKGETITPKALFEKEDKTTNDSSAAKAPVPDDFSIKHLLIYCLMPYRMSKIRDDYQTDLWKRLKNMLTGFPPALSTNQSNLFKERCFQSSRAYCSLVAVIDMFLNQFPNHESSDIRIATISSRFRDCAALLSINHFIDFTGISKYSEMMDWIFTYSCGQDMDRMTEKGQEIKDALSYFPYHVDLGLVRKSNYSAVINQSIFYWIHAVCALLGSSRSMNARMNLEANVPAVTTNALITAYVLKNRISMMKAYGGETDEQEFINAIKEGEEDPSIDDSGLPTSNQGGDWFLYLAKKKFLIPAQIHEFGKSRAGALNEAREGTVGQSLHKYFQ